MLQRWPGIRWEQSTFWKAFNKQNTRKCWKSSGCNQQKSAIDSARIRRSGNSTDYCFTDFNRGSWKKHVAAKFVPHLLSWKQKEFRAAVAQDLLETANNDPDFFKKVITGNESWVYGYDPETKVFPMEVTWVSTFEEGVAKSAQRQGHVECFFRSWRCCSPWVRFSRPDNN